MKSDKVYSVVWTVILFVCSYIANRIFDKINFSTTFLEDLYFKGIRTYNNKDFIDILSAFCGIIIVGYLLTLGKKAIKQKNHIGKIAALFISAIALYIFLLVFSLSILGAPKIAKKVSNNIEIISPYISQQEKNIFTSRLLQVENNQEFESLKKDIEEIAIKNKAKLQY